jgi:O-antigen/teichoic acid export membrane protein
MSVTNIISPALVSIDRFVIGAFVSISAVAYYATPYEIATKMLLIPWGLVGVLFPAFSSSLVEDRHRAFRLFESGVNITYLVLFPLTLVAVTFASQILQFWVGSEFAIHGGTVLKLLAAGVLFNGLAHVPFALIQGAGRPDVTAKFHLFELPIYLAVLWWLVTSYGVVGAAIAWAFRVGLDAVLLFSVVPRFLPDCAPFMRRTCYSVVLAVLAYLCGGLLTGAGRIAFIVLAIPLLSCATWFLILNSNDRALVTNLFSSRTQAQSASAPAALDA